MLGGLLGLGSLLVVPLLELRPNRVAEGPSYRALAIGGWPAYALLALWVAVVLLALQRGTGRDTPHSGGHGARGVTGEPITRLALPRGAAMALAGNLGFVALAGVVVRDTNVLLARGGQYARVSLAWGTWLALLATYVVLFAASQSWMQPDEREPAHCRWALRGAAFLRAGGLWWGFAAVVLAAVLGAFNQLSIAQELFASGQTFQMQLATHLEIAGAGVGLATLIGVPFGLFAARRRRLGQVVLAVTGLFQTVPSLALFGLLVVPVAALAAAYPLLRQLGVAGIGATPVLVALTIYGLLPIVRNTYTAIVEVDPALTDAARGMGMSRGQLLRKVELPLALPIILQGVRVAAVQLIGITALGALIAAGGLGTFIFNGISAGVNDLILVGALPMIVLAVIADRVLNGLARAVAPRGVRLPVNEGA